MGARRKEHVTGLFHEPQELKLTLQKLRNPCAMVDAITENIHKKKKRRLLKHGHVAVGLLALV